MFSGDMLSQKMLFPERGIARRVISTLTVNGEMRRTNLVRSGFCMKCFMGFEMLPRGSGSIAARM